LCNALVGQLRKDEVVTGTCLVKVCEINTHPLFFIGFVNHDNVL
jgi:hypothetical protein